MKLAKTNVEEIDNLLSILNELEYFNTYHSNQDLSKIDWDEYEILNKFDHSDYQLFFNSVIQYICKIHFKRILWNCETMLENCADPNLDYLDFNENIKEGLKLLEDKNKH